MNPVITADFRGLADLQRRLERMSKQEATKAGLIANRAGAAVLRKETIKKAPSSGKTTEGEVRTRHNKDGSTRQEIHGKIVNNVKVKKTKGDDATQVHHAVTISGKAYHANYVQFGSIHNAADPFMIEALDSSQQSIIDTVAKVLDKQLVKRGS